MTEDDTILTSARSVNSESTKDPTASKQIPDVVSLKQLFNLLYTFGNFGNFQYNNTKN